MKFITDDFMLHNEYAKTLFNKYAKDEPIFDFHCHLEAKEIYENKNFESITQVWLGGDHYKWRVMRASGVDEAKITGNATDYEKFEAWAKVVPTLIGNPLYHWTHLELKNYFGIDETLDEKSSKEIFDKCNELLKQDNFRPRQLIEKSKVNAICTTNDPTDELKYHKLLREEKDFKTLVVPAFRPDKALNIEKDDYVAYLKELEKVSTVEIKNYKDIEKALKKRLDYFEENGSKASDHALKYFPYRKVTEEELDKILSKKLNKKEISQKEEESYKTALLTFLAKEYKKRDWVMEIHVGCIRDNSKVLFDKEGPDVGNDGVNDRANAENLAHLLSDFEEKEGLPRILLFTLNEKDFYPLSTIGGCFNRANKEGLMNIQIGTSWWYLDHKDGMLQQMKTLANTSVFSKFVGMLTDSRSFLSYPRHEYFRRIMCNFVGEIVENGEYPWDEERLGEMVKNISYKNATDFIKVFEK